MTKFRDLEKNFELSSEKNLELNSTSGEAVIAVESRDHAKNNGVSPKDHTSRGNLLKMSVLFCVLICTSAGAWGQTFEFQDRFHFKFDLTNEILILDSDTFKIDVWKTVKKSDENYKTRIIFIHTDGITFAFYDDMFAFTGEEGNVPNDPMKWNILKTVIRNKSDGLIDYNFNQIEKAIDEKGQKMLDKIESLHLDNVGLRAVTGAGDNLRILAYKYLNPNAINKFANMLLKDSEDKILPEKERQKLILEAMELYEFAMKMGNEEAKRNYNSLLKK